MISADYLQYFQSGIPKNSREYYALKSYLRNQQLNDPSEIDPRNQELSRYAMDLYRALQQGKISAGLPLYGCRLIDESRADTIPPHNHDLAKQGLELFKALQRGVIISGLPLYKCTKVDKFSAIPNRPKAIFDEIRANQVLKINEQELVCRFITGGMDLNEASTRAHLCTMQIRARLCSSRCEAPMQTPDL
jgi:hypothetical protein